MENVNVRSDKALAQRTWDAATSLEFMVGLQHALPSVVA